MQTEEEQGQEQAQKDSQILHIAGLAKELLGNPLWEQVFTLLSAKYVENITRSKWEDADKREKLYLKYRVLQEIKAELTEAVSSGKIVEKRHSDADYQAAVVKEDED